VNLNAPKGSVEAYGDTETQTNTILTRIKALLGKFGFDMDDIVKKMNIYMVGDPSKGNAMDFAGMMTAYRAVFWNSGTAEQACTDHGTSRGANTSRCPAGNRSNCRKEP
jgi:enamine deaminase RidA (YjgF/YER057c/UK114 family)